MKPNKIMYLLCNAHIDPVWQWEWEEGAAATISTFRVAARFCDEYDGFVFNHNEALLYRWVEEYEPELFSKIQALVKAGKWHIMGGWHLQPDCNIPSGEAIVRQALEGRHYFYEKFGVVPTTAINFDPFGHSRGLVQILVKSGYDSYVFYRPNQTDCPLPAETFRWVGYDGSSVMAERSESYNTFLGKSLEKIKPAVERCADGGIALCLWGVGNHGGGASKLDLDQISEYQKELEAQGIQLIHTTPEEYFQELRDRAVTLPEHHGDLNRWAVGGYTSQIRVKQKYRAFENSFFSAEKLCSAADIQGLMPYPKQELDDVLYDLLTTQFHDTLPGTCIQPVEEMALRQMDHGLEILSRIRARAFFALSGGQEPVAPDAIPVLAYNPHPYPVEGDFECEFMLWDQNRNFEFLNPRLYQDGKAIPVQAEKEQSNIPIEWRKRIVFHATLPPMQMARFDCKFDTLQAKPAISVEQSEAFIHFKAESLSVKIGRKTGLIEQFEINGVPYLKPGAGSLQVVQDDFDPWGMNVNRFTDKIGPFTLLTPEETREFCALDEPIPAVRVIEDGAVRTVIEAVFGYGRSRAVLHYKLPKQGKAFGLDVRLNWNDKQKMVKLELPVAYADCECFGQVAYGLEQLLSDGTENVSQKYQIIANETQAVSVINDGIYGSSFENGILSLSLLRSPAYSAHPVDDRKVMVQDRFMPYIDQGERLYHFQLCAGNTEELRQMTARQAQVWNESPQILSFYPSGEGTKSLPVVELTGDPSVEMTAFKQAEDGDGSILRLYNSKDGISEITVKSAVLKIEQTIQLKPYEIASYHVTPGSMSPCNLIEFDS